MDFFKCKKKNENKKFIFHKTFYFWWLFFLCLFAVLCDFLIGVSRKHKFIVQSKFHLVWHIRYDFRASDVFSSDFWFVQFSNLKIWKSRETTTTVTRQSQNAKHMIILNIIFYLYKILTEILIYGTAYWWHATHFYGCNDF